MATTTEVKPDSSSGLFRIEPWDRHNQETVQNVRPNDRTNPEPAERYNLVVLGAGTAGLVSAIGAAGLGARDAFNRTRLTPTIRGVLETWLAWSR